MLKRGKLYSALLAGAICITGSGLGGTQVPQGVRFYISERGQQYFKTDLEALLKKNDLDLSKMRFPKIESRISDPFTSERLPKSVREKQGDLVKRLSENFSSYFSGLNLGQPTLKMTFENMGFEMNFKSLGVELDPRGPSAYGLNRGVVALLRGEATEFDFKISRLRAVDLKNPKLLGTLGLDQGRAELLEGEGRPARMEIPVLIDTDARGLTIRILAVRTNFTKVKLDAGFDALLLPSMEVIINGQRFAFDRKAFEQEVQKNLPDIVTLIQGALKSYFEKDSAEEIFKPHFDQVSKLANIQFSMPLGETWQPERVDLKVQPTRVSIDSKHFMLEFLATMKDPQFASGAGVFPAQGTASGPAFRTTPEAGYDVAFAVHGGIVNGFLDRLYSHQFLKGMKIGEDVVDMIKAPVFKLTGQDPRRAILHVEMQTDAENIAVRSLVPIEFDMRVRLAVNSKNEVDIIPEEILMDTVFVDRNRLKTWLFGSLKGMVEKRVREKLTRSNEGFRTKPDVMKSIPTLDDLMGIPLRLVDVAVDNGNLLIFSRYDLPK